jgi:hypothetical protein
VIASIVVVGLVAYRAWRLLALDDLLDRWRPSWEFLACPWCSGFWLAGLTSLVWHQGLSTDFVWVWLASSVIVGLIGEWSG